MLDKNIVERLRSAVRNKVGCNPGILTEAADRIEELAELNRLWLVGYELLQKNDNYKRYVEYWRNENGKNNLCYPSNLSVYEEFFELLERNKDLEEMVANLKTANLSLEARNKGEAYWIYDKDGNDWGIGAYRCSECGCKNDNLGITKSPFNVMSFAGSKYCPHCGVKMVGEHKAKKVE